MKEPLYGNGIRGLLDEALAENAAAKSRFESLSETDRAAFLRRTEGVRSREEMKGLLDALTGWQEGHPPYQL